MRRRRESIACVIVVFVCLLLDEHQLAGGELTISGPRCGVLTCKPQEYCSSFDNQCKSCADICNKESHNFEEKLCVDRCQDYLHDIRYVRLDASSSNSKSSGSGPFLIDNSNDINKLYTIATIAIVLAIFLLVCNGAYIIYKLYNWAKKNDINSGNIISYFKGHGTNEDVEKGASNGVPTTTAVTPPKRALHLNVSGGLSQSDQLETPATMTTSISRRPAEDSTLDYAYDNHAMSGTPSPRSGTTPHESNF